MSSRKRTPDKESTETTTAVVEPPAADVKPDTRSFADRVGQKRPFTPAADPYGIAHDNLAGIRLFESKQDRQPQRPNRGVDSFATCGRKSIGGLGGRYGGGGAT